MHKKRQNVIECQWHHIPRVYTCLASVSAETVPAGLRLKGANRRFATECVRARSASDDRQRARAQDTQCPSDERSEDVRKPWFPNLHRRRSRRGTSTVISGGVEDTGAQKPRTPDEVPCACEETCFRTIAIPRAV